MYHYVGILINFAPFLKFLVLPVRWPTDWRDRCTETWRSSYHVQNSCCNGGPVCLVLCRSNSSCITSRAVSTTRPAGVSTAQCASQTAFHSWEHTRRLPSRRGTARWGTATTRLVKPWCMLVS